MVIFIGGIHGSGKGTFCKKISSQAGIPHFTASELLKWNEVSPDIRNKKVLDIPDTQNRLIFGLINILKQHPEIILDGHFCLFNKEGEVVKVDIDTFKQINPEIIVLVKSEIEEIQQRLYLRDSILYDLHELKKMQDLEVEYSKEVAIKLEIPYFQLDNNNLHELITLIIESK